MFTTEYTGISTASPHAVWDVLSDVAGWSRWNDGVDTVELDGAPGVGTEFRLTAPGQGTLVSRIVEFQHGARLTDLTEVEGVSVTVVHLLEDDGEGGTRIVYRVQADGPVDDVVLRQIGEDASQDFPDVIAALARVAEGR